MPLRDDQAALIAEYLGRGGTIRRVASSEPCDPSEVLIYLRENGFNVRIAPGQPGLVLRHLYNNRPISSRKMVELANQHRAARKLPLFANDPVR